jgi:hypothetical protein
MSEIPFYATGYGRRFFESQLPRLIEALEKIGEEMREQRLEQAAERVTHGGVVREPRP